jgi:cell wall-associated NlpC family hydrolase
MTHRALLRALTTLSAALALVATTFSLAPAGVAHAPSTEQTNVVARTAGASVSTRVLRAKNIALGQLGDPYAYGAAGPHRFDCSGLVFFATHAAGFRGVPRTSGAQAGFMRPIAKSRMRPGDFMFFYGRGGVYHAAIFLGWDRGGARMVHALGSGRRVSVARPWTTSWFGRTLR